MHYDIVTTLQNNIACGAGLFWLCKPSAVKWLFKHRLQLFPQKPVLNTFTTCYMMFPPWYKTNPSVRNREKKHRQPGNEPAWAGIHNYLGEGAIWSRKCRRWKDCPGRCTQMSTNNVGFCTRSRPYQREAYGPTGPGSWTVAKTLFFFGKKRYVSEPSVKYSLLYFA